MLNAIRNHTLTTPHRLNFSDPTILNLKNTTFNPEYAVIPENFSQGYVYLVITASIVPGLPPKINAPANHPIHLHGHDFVILAQSTEPYDVNESVKTFKFNNPPRRDVALLPLGGYLAIAFKPDNPGVWLLHCHIGETSPFSLLPCSPIFSYGNSTQVFASFTSQPTTAACTDPVTILLPQCD